MRRRTTTRRTRSARTAGRACADPSCPGIYPIYPGGKGLPSRLERDSRPDSKGTPVQTRKGLPSRLERDFRPDSKGTPVQTRNNASSGSREVAALALEELV